MTESQGIVGEVTVQCVTVEIMSILRLQVNEIWSPTQAVSSPLMLGGVDSNELIAIEPCTCREKLKLCNADQLINLFRT